MPPARAVFYALTVAALAYSVRAVLVGPPPVWAAALALTLYLAALMAGVLSLRLREYVDAQLTAPAGKSGVALTFDDGPDPETTPRVLDALDAAGAKATFFVIGRKAERHPELVREILRRGHDVGLHSYAHDRLFAMRGPRRWRKDLKRGIRALEGITGARPRLFRPPIGHTNPHVAGVLRELGLRVVGWSLSARDGVAGSASRVAERVLGRVRDGDIVLLHDASERGDRTPAGVDALPAILRGLEQRGVALVALSAWR
jgi:peptidoglycan/xylan/chitin deacetylase (PgdA/CDA1 family)